MRLKLALIAGLWLAPLGAQAEPACYLLQRVIEWKDLNNPNAEYAPWSRYYPDVHKFSFLKLDLKKNVIDANISEIWTFWLRQNLVRAYSMKKFWISRGRLYFKFIHEQIEKINGTWISGSLKTLSSKNESLAPGETKVFYSEINDRAVRVTMRLSEYGDMQACAPPDPKVPSMPKKSLEF